ncbi:hypothetical protein SNE40_008340 [Patella caerulea]|uniref:Ribosomal RNA-processing protein 8 n=1 Tax=Patella caerulea TaxID=87958 RepID=A0AAN8QAA2_PATCE
MDFGSATWGETNDSECLNTALFGSVSGKKTSVKKLNKKGDDLEKETKQSKEFLKKLKFSDKKKNVKIVSFDVSDDSDGDYDDISKRSKKSIKERQRKKVKKEEEKKKKKIKKQQLDSDEELYAEIDEETPQIYAKKKENSENIKKLHNEISPSSINKQKNQKKTKEKAKETKAQKRKASNVTIETTEPVVLKKSKKDDTFTVQKCQIEQEKSLKKKRKKAKKPKNRPNSDKDDDKPLTVPGKKQRKETDKEKEAVDEKKPQTELKLLDKKEQAMSTNKKKVKKPKIEESFESDQTLKREKILKVDALEKTRITGSKDGLENVKKTKPTDDTVVVNEAGINSAKAKKKKQKNKKKKSNETESNQNGSFQMTNGKTVTPKVKPNFNKAKLASLFSNRNKNLVNDVHVHVQKKQVPDKSPANFSDSLKEKMSGQLNAARFRYLNEQLYTQTGKEALDMFQTDVEAFDIYHKGFQSQVAKWPVNPLDLIIKSIKKLPATHIIADFGCGNATLAQSVPNKVHSFDLAPLNEFVTVCDVSKVPLSNKTVDVAVFCLSLMGTNLNDFVMEANRVLKPGGLLQIAEVESRIPHTETFIIQIESFGFEYVKKDTSHKMFHLFDFKKVRAGTKSAVKDIKLDPCLYKKR